MKKIIIVSILIGSVILVALVALGIAGYAYAQSQLPPAQTPWTGPTGMMGAGMGYRMGMMQGYGRGMMQGTYGPMHTAMLQALASRLGMTVEQLQAKIDGGETPWEIASSQGLTAAQIQDLMNQAHDEALKAAVAAGTLTQAQADAMDQHMEQMGQYGGMSGMMGRGTGNCNGRFSGGNQP